jgi:hypothetical protein
MRIGRYWRLPLARGHLDASGERQNDEGRDEQRMHVHYAATGSIRLGSLFLTFQTRGLTDVALVSADAGVREAASFDDLVGAGKDRGRDGEAERCGRLEVDDKLEGGRLLHRQISGLGSRENAADIAPAGRQAPVRLLP